jgi:hypothetical protein
MPTAHAADFPMGLRVRCTLSKERRAWYFRAPNVSDCPVPGNRREIRLLSAFFAKRTALGTPALACKVKTGLRYFSEMSDDEEGIL